MAQVLARTVVGALFDLARWSAAARVVAAQAPPPVPPPVEQRTADCAARVYASDVLVCDDPDLWQADRRLAGLLLTAAQAGVEEHGPLLEPATAWFRRRSLCAFSTEVDRVSLTAT